jgi:AcrR family transcriptional regulator
MAPRARVAPLRRERIAAATIRCLARDGYSGLTMKKVAREAGVSQGILHYYFADKRAILVAALERVLADLHDRVEREARGTTDPRRRLRALIRACLAVATQSRDFWVVFVEFWGQMVHDRRLLAINADLYTRVRRLIGAVVAQGTRAGFFRRVDAEHAGAVILALVDGLSLQLTFDPEVVGRAEAQRLCEEAVFRYLASAPAGRNGGERRQ